MSSWMTVTHFLINLRI